MRSKILLFLVLSLSLLATEGKLKVSVKSHETIYTSQKIIVAVELMTDAFSISDARILFPASDKYIVQAPQSAAFIRQREINGTDWQVVNYEYEVYALKAGKIEISPVSATFSASMGYGQPKTAFDLKSDALHFEVKAPEGTNNDQFVLVTNDFALTHTVKPEKQQLIVGDAVEFEVTQKASGVPDILLQPVRYSSNTHLRVYDKEPELKSRISGTHYVSRTDRFTFVASKEGNVTVPEKKIFWWNSGTKKVQVETVPEMTFEIIADPQIALDERSALIKKRVIAGVLIAAVFVLFYFLFEKKVKRWVKQRKTAYEESEAGRFARLMEAKHPKECYRLFYHWLGKADPVLFREGFAGIVRLQPTFSDVLSSLEQRLAGNEEKCDKMAFEKEAKKLRARVLANEQAEQLASTLNP